MAAASSTKQLAEELRYYARSDKHLRHFQTWLSAAAPAHPVSVIDPTATAVEAVDGEDARAKSVMQTQFFPLLKTNTLGGIVLFSPALPSTQTLLHDTLRPSPPAGVLCYTEHQLQGKGRGSNVWFSPEGCLTFSYSSSLVDGNTLPFVQYLASLAIIRAVEAVNPKSSNKVSPVRIKWPNDIYVDTVKIGGMICQSEYRDGKFSVTTGIGINISNKAPTICLQDVLSTEAVPCTVTKEEFLAAFCNAYEPMEEIFQQQGFEPFMTEYLEKWLHTNQVVQVSSDAVGVAPGTTVPAVIKGLTSTGCLLAESEGNRFELYPDGNSFDFLSGLLKRKL